MTIRRWTLLFVVVAGLSTAGVQGIEPPDRQRRRTPVVDVFEKCRDAVVNISTTRVEVVRYDRFFDDIFDMFEPPRTARRKVQSIGSGFVVHERGYIVTNAHVVARASDIKASFADGRTVPAQMVAVDQEHDLAILRIKADHPLKALTLGHSNDIMVGETVVAIGNPLGLQHTVTAGIVSALNRQLDFGPDVQYRGLIQTDAAINPGNSGGPLLNINAELIGINTAIRGDAQNVGFAIAVDRLWELLPVMLDIQRRQRVRFGLKVTGSPARVVAVEPGSPAAATNLHPGDQIVRFGGQPVRNGIDFYVALLDERPGQTVALEYVRDGSAPQAARIKLETVPLPDSNALAHKLLGLGLRPFPDEIRRRYDLPEDLGLLVDQVDPRSPAARADIRVDDLIRSIDRIPIRDMQSLGLVLESVQPGQEVYIEGVRLAARPPFRWRVLLRAAR